MKTLTFMTILLGSTAAMAAQAPSQSECQTLWQQASGQSQSQSQSGSQTQLTQAQASKYINSNNFKQVDTNNDGQISQQEFMVGCANGLVQQQASQ